MTNMTNREFQSTLPVRGATGQREEVRELPG